MKFKEGLYIYCMFRERPFDIYGGQKITHEVNFSSGIPEKQIFFKNYHIKHDFL